MKELRKGRCSHCRGRRPSTHVVKWPVVVNHRDGTAIPEVIKKYVCAICAHAVLDFVRYTGTDMHVYRYRRLPAVTITRARPQPRKFPAGAH